jgi:hypothetical protein
VIAKDNSLVLTSFFLNFQDANWYVSLWSLLKYLPKGCATSRFFLKKEVPTPNMYTVVRSCLITPNENPIAWQLKWHFLQNWHLCHIYWGRTAFLTILLLFWIQKHPKFESHQFNMLKMFLLALQSVFIAMAPFPHYLQYCHSSKWATQYKNFNLQVHLVEDKCERNLNTLYGSLQH